MAQRQYVNYTVEDGIATVIWENPPVNALCKPLVEELWQVLEELETNETVRVVILTGAGERAFSAGVDIRELASIEGSQDGKAFVEFGKKICDRIEFFSKPVIAAIHGICAGGGAEIVEACTIRIAADNTQIGQPEIRLGIIPGWGGTIRLPKLIGEGRALELMLTGDLISAEEAFRIGWVDKLVSRQSLLDESKTLARKIADKSKIAVKLLLRSTREGTRLTQKEGLQLETDLFCKSLETADRKEGTRAFLEKRQPKWQDK